MPELPNHQDCHNNAVEAISIVNFNASSNLTIVFEKEPLPKDSFIWEHDKIQFTPHIASITNVKAVIPQVVKNYKNLLSGNKLINLVNRDKKY